MNVIKRCHFCGKKINVYDKDTYSHHEQSNPNKKVYVCGSCLTKKICENVNKNQGGDQ